MHYHIVKISKHDIFQTDVEISSNLQFWCSWKQRCTD